MLNQFPEEGKASDDLVIADAVAYPEPAGAAETVTGDIPPWCVAAGNPCRVIRTITEADKAYAYKDCPVDKEIWESMK